MSQIAKRVVSEDPEAMEILANHDPDDPGAVGYLSFDDALDA